VAGLPPPLPARTRRVLVAGSTGAGKTTAARVVAAALGLPHVELDALWHGPGWVPRPAFEDDVAAMLATGRWVTEYQYRPVKAALLSEAQAVVWPDHPFPLVAARLVRRPATPCVVFSREFAAERARTASELADAASRGVVVVRLRGGRQAERWLTAQRAAAG
jgi:adenylate kinase family enzyme